jgi:hypothetical protein
LDLIVVNKENNYRNMSIHVLVHNILNTKNKELIEKFKRYFISILPNEKDLSWESHVGKNETKKRV